MKEETSEQNGNEKHIYHSILSRCGEHKMKLILAITVIGAILGGQLVLFQQPQCSFITMNLRWNTEDTYEIEGNQAVRCYENEAVKLYIELGTSQPGVLSVTVKPESGKPVWLTVTKEDSKSWQQKEVQVYFNSSDQSIQKQTPYIWVKAEKDKDGVALHTIIVRAVLRNQNCEAISYAYIDVSTPPPTTALPSTNTPEPTKKPNNGCCGGASLILSILICGVLTKSLKR